MSKVAANQDIDGDLSDPEKRPAKKRKSVPKPKSSSIVVATPPPGVLASMSDVTLVDLTDASGLSRPKPVSTTSAFAQSQTEEEQDAAAVVQALASGDPMEL